jgi:hypothetical protein
MHLSLCLCLCLCLYLCLCPFPFVPSGSFVNLSTLPTLDEWLESVNLVVFGSSRKPETKASQRSSPARAGQCATGDQRMRKIAQIRRQGRGWLQTAQKVVIATLAKDIVQKAPKPIPLLGVISRPPSMAIHVETAETVFLGIGAQRGRTAAASRKQQQQGLQTPPAAPDQGGKSGLPPEMLVGRGRPSGAGQVALGADQQHWHSSGLDPDDAGGIADGFPQFGDGSAAAGREHSDWKTNTALQLVEVQVQRLTGGGIQEQQGAKGGALDADGLRIAPDLRPEEVQPVVVALDGSARIARGTPSKHGVQLVENQLGEPARQVPKRSPIAEIVHQHNAVELTEAELGRR